MHVFIIQLLDHTVLFLDECTAVGEARNTHGARWIDALALFLKCNLSEEQYQMLRMGAKAQGANILGQTIIIFEVNGLFLQCLPLCLGLSLLHYNQAAKKKGPQKVHNNTEYISAHSA